MKFILILLLFIFGYNVNAEDITKNSDISINNITNNILIDNNENTFMKINKNDSIIINSDNDISGIYIIYEKSSQKGNISNNTNESTIGDNGFLHEYIDIDKLIGKSKKITIKYEENVEIGEIYILSDGNLPNYIEVWEEPCEEADLLLLTTHSDDEQLFFLGLLPTYISKGANVQVVYFAHHNDNPKRLHEQLHGLYTVGVRNYPITGYIPDAYSETLEGAIKNMESAGITLDDAINFQIKNIRRFKPLVIVGHDELGEYSHGQHILNTHVLKLALERTNDKNYDLDSFKKYGLWNVPKTYLHLYEQNKIIMNYDEPLEYFDGKTAYEVSKEGYSKHYSQQWTWFTKWINGTNNSYTKATDIKTYSPTEYGLYKSLVGEDINKNDMFENLTMRKDIKEDKPIKEKIDKIKKEVKKNKNYKKYIIWGTIGVFIFIILILKKNKTK